jgi:hypothetical protein
MNGFFCQIEQALEKSMNVFVASFRFCPSIVFQKEDLHVGVNPR